MKKLLLLVAFLAFASSAWCKNLKIVVVPEQATIKVNGSYYGTGSADIKIKKNDFILVECSCPGYESLHTRIYGNDDRKIVEIKLKEDMLLKQTLESSIANSFFTVQVDKSLYTVGEDGKRNTEKAWKMAHSVLLQYFDEIMVSDITSGFIQTPWYYQNYIDSGKVIRCRVTIKESNIGGDLTFQIKLSSEITSIQSSHREESYVETNRIIKKYENIVEEFQTRLGAK